MGRPKKYLDLPPQPADWIHSRQLWLQRALRDSGRCAVCGAQPLVTKNYCQKHTMSSRARNRRIRLCAAWVPGGKGKIPFDAPVGWVSYKVKKAAYEQEVAKLAAKLSQQVEAAGLGLQFKLTYANFSRVQAWWAAHHAASSLPR